MTTPPPPLDPETEHEKAQLFNRELWRLRKQFATLLIGSRYGHDDPLDTELEPVVRELVVQHEKNHLGHCEWCGVRAPVKSVKDPHGAEYVVYACAWGCGDQL